MPRNVYPFQVPAVSTELATRGAAPREHFCEATKEDESDVEPNKIRHPGASTVGAKIEPEVVERPGSTASRPEDWEL